MNSRAIALGAGALTALAVAALIAVQARHEFDSQVQAKTFGPSNETFAFTADPTGRAGPANDCVVCHSIEKNGPLRSAPSLWGIVGAPKARADWFSYSLALRKKGGVWSEVELDRYLTKPSGFIPGTSKTLPPIEDTTRRQNLISYLKTLQG
ncbi:MAG: c-type cytochrome [Rhodoplanes sp.]